MKVIAIWEFEADVEGYNPEFVNIPGLANELAKNELAYCIKYGDLTADDFEYVVKCDEEEGILHDG